MKSTQIIVKNAIVISFKKFFLACFLIPFLSSYSTAAQVTLQWDAPPQNITGYIVHYGTESQSYPNEIYIGIRTSYTLNSLEDGQTYYFAVTAFNENGESDYSNEASFDTLDYDNDGIMNEFDDCPQDPANDTDGDGICGEVDNCPAVENPSQSDTDSDGTGDACDGCPDDPEKTDPGLNGCGVPENQTDNSTTPVPSVPQTDQPQTGTEPGDTGTDGKTEGGSGSGGAGTDSSSGGDTNTCSSNNDCPGTLVCDTQTGLCVQCTEDTHCADGIFCNGDAFCSHNICIDGKNPCSEDEICDEANDLCTPDLSSYECLSNEDCDDGIFCNGEEICTSGTCVSGTPPCDSGQECNEINAECRTMITLPESHVYMMVVRRPVSTDKKCLWLIMRYDGELNLSDPNTYITIQGAEDEFYGLEVDEETEPVQTGSFLFIPVCMERTATVGRWIIKIEFNPRSETTNTDHSISVPVFIK